ncbi:MAG: glycosyltransferase, partial [Actinomycetes bacterium]
LTLVEAISAGVPVMGGKSSGGVPFVVNYGAAGWLCDVSDPDKLADAILEKVDGGPPSMAITSRNYIESNFAPEVVAKKYLSWYGSFLEKS